MIRITQVLDFSRRLFALVLSISMIGTAWTPIFADDDWRHEDNDSREIDLSKWGAITAPVYGTSESGPYAGAELFAGPNKFGSYFSGVLPNGRIVKPAGTSIQIGMNPLGIALSPDGKYLVTSNNDEREGGFASYQSKVNVGGYSLSVINTSTMSVVSQTPVPAAFIGLQVTGKAAPYTVWASGGAENTVRMFTLSDTGTISPATPASIKIAPILPSDKGYASNYLPDTMAIGAKPVPTGFDAKKGAQTTFPAGSAVSRDGKYLYVACNGDNSVAVIDTATQTVVKQVPVGFFPYGVVVSHDGSRIAVSNWGITEYKFGKPTYDSVTGKLTDVQPYANNQPKGFFVPVTSTTGMNPQTSSISILCAPGAKGDSLSLLGSVYEGRELDVLKNVGDTHPSAIAIVRHGKDEILYVTKSNVDRLGVIDLTEGRKLHDINLSPILAENDRYQGDGDRDSDDLRRVKVSGAYPNAIVVSPDNDRLYVAEAGLNSVAVLDTSECRHPKLLGRIPTGWYPTALTISQDGRYLYVTNAKGIGEDINPSTPSTGTPPPTGLASDPRVDSNFIFGSLQKIDLAAYDLDNHSVLAYNFAKHHDLDISVVPVGQEPSKKIKHVFFILHENKTFDSMLGNLSAHFGNYAGTTFTNIDGSAYTNGQFTGVALNTQLLAAKFAAGANYYSDSEESDAGHQFAASGTATDYTEKTLLVKSGRGLLVNKNFEPEDYPASGYIFNNAARHNVSFKDYGAMIRIDGTDTGTSVPTTVNDSPSGNLGYPTLKADNFSIISPVVNAGDVSSPTKGLGQSYFLTLPIVAVLGTKNKSGEARLDLDYPGYNFNISDQRRAAEFIQDFDRMVNQGTLPEFVYIYQPNDHTGGMQAPNKGSVITNSPVQQVADGDVGLGMVVKHIMESPVYYNDQTGEGSAIFITYDDAQSTRDHIHPHRTPLVVVSPYAKPGYVSLRHYVTASVVKTEELLLGLPPNNLGDLFATDLRDLFQPKYNHITAKDLAFNLSVTYTGSKEGAKIWKLVSKLDTSAPDRDSFRLGALARMSMRADELHNMASATRQLHSGSYKAEQSALYRSAIKLVNTSMPKDADD